MSLLAEPAAGLRERKKLRTREALREHAMRLFREQGFAATTVEQIAEAAEVSPSTFFRYFPTKEDIVLVNDFDPLMVAALAEQPIEENPIAAVKAAIAAVYSHMSDDDIRRERERRDLLQSVPALRATFMEEFRRKIDLLVAGMAERLGRPVDDFELRVFAGAVIGASLAVHDCDRFDRSLSMKALDFLADGLPLTKP